MNRGDSGAPDDVAGMRDQIRSWIRHDVSLVGNTGYPDIGPLAKVIRRALPPRIALRLRVLATDALRPIMSRRARRLGHGGPLRLQLGSGRFHKEGWVNVDLLGAHVEVAWNVTRPLPFVEGCADVIFHEHILEHLSLEQGLSLLHECHRVLRPGGILRIGVPDAGAYALSYAGKGDLLSRVRPGRPTPLLALQEVFYWDGHRVAYDAETLVYVCRAAGFADVEPRQFGQTHIEPSPDGEHRRLESLYVECAKN